MWVKGWMPWKGGDWNPLKNYGYQSHMFTSTTDRTHAKIFCQSSQKRCKEKTRKWKRGNCKAFCVTSNCNKERAMFSNLKKWIDTKYSSKIKDFNRNSAVYERKCLIMIMFSGCWQRKKLTPLWNLQNKGV